MEMKKTIDEWMQLPYWIIDILPEQVPKDSPGQYFAVEKYFLEEKQLEDIKKKHINVILKLNCYRNISIEDGAVINPEPEELADKMKKQVLCIMTDEAMILSEPDDTYMTVFHQDEKLLHLIQAIASAEGLFVWSPSK